MNSAISKDKQNSRKKIKRVTNAEKQLRLDTYTYISYTSHAHTHISACILQTSYK